MKPYIATNPKSFISKAGNKPATVAKAPARIVTLAVYNFGKIA